MAPKSFISTFLCCLALINLTRCQDQTGFISIDCGLQPENSTYDENSTGIQYVSDSQFTDTGISMIVAPEYRATATVAMESLRSFPEGARNCYTLPVNTTTKYLIRARFAYGNYDSRNEIPEFDLHLGPNKWDTVKLDSVSQFESKEIIHYASSETLQVCLVNTGRGTPFISALELRPLPNSSYAAKSGSLQLFARLDFGSTTNQSVRYPDDVFDRIWLPYIPEGSKQLSSSNTVLSGNNSFRIPQVVMRGAAIPANATDTLGFAWSPDDPSLEFYVYFYFAELQELNSNQRRETVILLNGKLFYGPLTLNYLRTTVLYTLSPLKDQSFDFSVVQTQNSTLPPLINAMEVYFANKLPESPTDQNDLVAIMNIKSAYRIKKSNWQGDPCMPRAYSWDGITCSYDNGTVSPRIVALNLSSSGLAGVIVPDISRLERLQVLDLSNNNLSGPVPAFLAQLQFLRILDLSNNQLTGPIPSELVARTRDGLSLRLIGNPSVCSVSSCEILQSKPEKKKKLPRFVIPLLASVAGFFLLVSVSTIILFFLTRRRKRGHPIHRTVTATSGPSLRRRDTASIRSSLPRIESGMTEYEFNETALDVLDLDRTQRKFKYSEIVNITNGFETDLGKGGFGRNYHGYLDNKEVTVKLLSSSTPQGYKQLQAEAKHLFRIHHKNLITLFGYCNEGDKMALVYEHMPNGNLKHYISENSTTVFSWEDRLGIALDVGQGLEYLHSGCKPPIIHRNVKCTNIFLDERFNAKLGGFGLSRAFDAEEGTHLNTAIAGTPGYVDPEYYTSNILTEKSDVYSFGVVLLEIITAKPAIMRTEERMHLSQWVETRLSTGNIDEVIDPKLDGDYDPNSASKVMEVAVACVSRSSRERPTMSQAVTALKESLAAEIDRKKRMQTVSEDSVEELVIGFGTNPRLR
ncbi:PREDICTED: probable LRR receptor-like serine/threonine-protein kinase At1g51880 [Tarenaya hassleriana]|uniref:probable LRR receptor-like serine/threonine-protein kinase At1g51880 n=1 Tax=Tarenaya hassleriana TaxID=28532 RepID=UPI00053C2304|nr:PREDICTED: probable LRR receptor-like serine/threonine-protein kinase At1g51880 [Tarenaya hassleriana]